MDAALCTRHVCRLYFVANQNHAVCQMHKGGRHGHSQSIQFLTISESLFSLTMRSTYTHNKHLFSFFYQLFNGIIWKCACAQCTHIYMNWSVIRHNVVIDSCLCIWIDLSRNIIIIGVFFLLLCCACAENVRNFCDAINAIRVSCSTSSLSDDALLNAITHSQHCATHPCMWYPLSAPIFAVQCSPTRVTGKLVITRLYYYVFHLFLCSVFSL